MTLIYALLAALAIMLVSLIGKITTLRSIGPWVERNLNYLVSFSAGVFVIIALDLGRESLELSSSPVTALAAIFGGLLLMHIISHMFPEMHHHHETGDPEDQHAHVSGKRILISDALHNIGDGFLLVPAFFVSPILGAITAFAIFIHELAQEISEFFVLRQAGYSVRKALTLNFAVSSTILIGVLGGYFLSQSEQLLGGLLGIAAGAFIYVVSRDLIPNSIEASRTERRVSPFILAALLGMIFFTGITSLVSHEHEETAHYVH